MVLVAERVSTAHKLDMAAVVKQAKRMGGKHSGWSPKSMIGTAFEFTFDDEDSAWEFRNWLQDTHGIRPGKNGQSIESTGFHWRVYVSFEAVADPDAWA